ncbi:sulfurtransferase complex subunit TusB [Pseudomonas sp. 15FMM2]|uniref:Sulfurtransferase complex subunit TusB n=1 Tax=Pseudomonas imrae TaxID=2992837 RepID=A0ACC7PCD2_9PSED
MSTLHVLSHSPFTDNRLDSCLRLCGGQDAILLCGDATYALQAGSSAYKAMRAKAVEIFVLIEDSQARGLQVPDWANSVDYPAFVQLSIKHDKVNTWL